MDKRIREKINEFLDKQGVKRTDLAALLGMKVPTLISQLNGTRGLSIDVIMKIFAAYPDLNKDWVFTGSGEMLYSELTSKSSPAALMSRIDQLKSTVKEYEMELLKRDAQIELLQKMLQDK
ncbi:MAG: helix-turn-helix domain-containing protein [Paludibacteraceae bacterium]|nr:helix-turn-helix domain-containing protein [Paludibacteraceae bacterium]